MTILTFFLQVVSELVSTVPVAGPEAVSLMGFKTFRNLQASKPATYRLAGTPPLSS